MIINAKDNKKIKYIKKLLKSGKFRKEEKKFVVEGTRIVKDTPQEYVEEIFYNTSYLKKNEDLIKDFRKNFNQTKFYEVDDSVLKAISDTKTPQGILAICRKKSICLEECINDFNQKQDSEVDVYVVLEDIQDPGNLGTIIRSALATGVKGIILTKECVDVYSPKVVRSTMGTIFKIQIVTDCEIKQVIKTFQENKVCVYAADLEGAQEIYKTDFNKNCAILIGNEGNGLKKETSSLSDCKIKIPMEEGVESLNAGVATSVILYEIYRNKNYNL